MALIPNDAEVAEDDALDEIDYDSLDEESEVTAEYEPPVTTVYALDFENKRIGKLVSGTESIVQIVTKAIMTPRYEHLIYTDYYGSELEDLIGEDVTDEYLDAEVPRLVTESIAFDDRIKEVTDITYERKGDQLVISVTVTPADGSESVDVEVTI